MKRSPREQTLYLLSILFAVAPFAFGIIRAVQTHHDLRLIWMAFASFIGTLVVEAVAKTRSLKPGVLGSSAATFVVATLLAGLTGYLVGARAAAGVWGVAFVLGFCWAASFALNSASRPQSI